MWGYDRYCLFSCSVMRTRTGFSMRPSSLVQYIKQPLSQ